MQFHLNYNPKSSESKIKHEHKIMLIGSCFAENIGDYLHSHKFKTLVNPNGILFNPTCIYHALINCVENKIIDDSLILKRNDLFFSYSHHSSVYHQDENELKLNLNTIQKDTYDFLKVADHLIITFGTAFVYRHKQHNTIVANCHKQPSVDFEKKLLSVDEIVTEYKNLIHSLKKFNPQLKIIFTVSPVKYLKDGIEENNISKATLLLAIHQLKKEFDLDYFPAFELVNDDLRDYRFYKEDLAHPNDLAIKYIWGKFSDVYFTDETKNLNKEIFSITSSEKHNLFFPESEEAKKFIANIAKKKKELKSKFPFLEI